jgi:beta-lactamase regulating signal transducer with metallopeptidase domain
MLRTLLELALSNAIVALAPAALAVLVSLCCRRPALVHALWLLVLLKLVTPPLVRVSLPWPAEPAAAAPAEPADEPAPAAVVALDPPDEGEEEEDEPPGVLHLADEREVLVEAAPAPAEEQEPARASLPWAEGLGTAWLLGSACWFALAVRRARSFSRALVYATRAPPELASRVAELARLVGLSRPPRTLLVPGRVTPMVWGAFQPVLLVPAGLLGQIGGDAMDTLILHELAHVRRRDPWVRALEFLCLGLFWWNPLAWYARQQLRLAEEQCCDAWVVRVMPQAARTYAVALVDALDFLCGPPPAAPALACGIGEVADLKRRLKMILGKTTPHSLGRAGGLAVLALGVLLLPLMAGIGRADEEEQQDSRPKPKRNVEQEADDATLQKMQQDLQRRLQEVEQARKRLEEAKKKAELAKAKAKEKNKEAKGGDATTIIIQISGSDGKEFDAEKLKALLKKAMPDMEVKVLVTRQGKDRQSFGFGFKGGPPGQGGGFGWGKSAPKAEAPKAPELPKVPQPPAPVKGPAPGPKAQPDKRVEELEKKLDAILKELEEMKKELKGGQKGKGRGGFGGGGNFGPKQ